MLTLTFTAGVDHSCAIQHDNSDFPPTEIEASAVYRPKAVGGPIITQSITAVSPLSSTLQYKFPKASFPSLNVLRSASSPKIHS